MPLRQPMPVNHMRPLNDTGKSGKQAHAHELFAIARSPDVNWKRSKAMLLYHDATAESPDHLFRIRRRHREVTALGTQVG